MTRVRRPPLPMDRVLVPVQSLAAAGAVTALLAHATLEVVGVIVDVGRMRPLDGLRDAVLSAGARRCHVVDARATVAEQVCWPVLRSGALGVAGAPIEGAVALPAVASAVVETAAHEAITAVAPWADDPADRQRLRALLRGLAPTLGLVSVAGHGAGAASQNLWADVVSSDGTDAPTHTHRHAATAVALRVGFERGIPRTVNGVPLSAVELIERLHTLLMPAGLPVERAGATSTSGGWVVDAPVSRVLHQAVASLTTRLYDPAMAEVAQTVAVAYATIVRDGTWFGPLRCALDGFVDRAIAPATAEVSVRIAGGHIEVET